MPEHGEYLYVVTLKIERYRDYIKMMDAIHRAGDKAEGVITAEERKVPIDDKT